MEESDDRDKGEGESDVVARGGPMEELRCCVGPSPVCSKTLRLWVRALPQSALGAQ